MGREEKSSRAALQLREESSLLAEVLTDDSLTC